MMIRPDELAAVRNGEIDLAFRRWDRPRVRVGTRMRTGVGLVEVTSVDQVALSALRAEDARRAGAGTLRALRDALAHRTDRAVFRVGLRYAGPDPREALRDTVPDRDETAQVLARLDRLDAASAIGPWTRPTLDIIDRSPGVRAPDLAGELGRETADFKKDVRKLKELGLTESLAIGYRVSPRGEAVIDQLLGPRQRPARPAGTPLPRAIGAPATGALQQLGVTGLEQVTERTADELLALHGVGPVAVRRLGDALAERGLAFRAD